jgi:REP element-mobilizing transposase RayT
VLTRNPGHLKAFDYSGLHRYFLTLCTHNRHRLFIAQEAVDVLLQIQRAAEDLKFAILAYCFMQFGDRLWQRYGFERVLRDDEATLDVARYILRNPVRAGLVDVPED